MINYAIDEKRFKDKMTEHDLSLVKLEQLTGIPKSCIQRYINGITKKIPGGRMEKLAKALRTNPDYLTGWTDNDSIDFDGIVWADNFNEEQSRRFCEMLCTLSSRFSRKIAELIERPEVRVLLDYAYESNREEVWQTIYYLEDMLREKSKREGRDGSIAFHVPANRVSRQGSNKRKKNE